MKESQLDSRRNDVKTGQNLRLPFWVELSEGVPHPPRRFENTTLSNQVRELQQKARKILAWSVSDLSLLTTVYFPLSIESRRLIIILCFFLVGDQVWWQIKFVSNKKKKTFCGFVSFSHGDLTTGSNEN